MKTIIEFLTISLILISCHKNSPAIGDYRAIFNGTYEASGNNLSELKYITISEYTKDDFLIGNSKISKNGGNIEGEIEGFAGYSSMKINGKCQKKKGAYFITGTYKALDYSGNIINGDFEIIPN